MNEQTMKIAVVTDDGEVISAHFGRATQYAVLTIEDGQVIERELREKAGHHTFEGEGHHEHRHRDDLRGRGFGQHAGEKHARMIAPIADCQMVLARGMGQGAYAKLKREGIRPVLTDMADIDEAVQAVIEGTIVNHLERLH